MHLWMILIVAQTFIATANEIDNCNRKEICAFNSRERNCYCDSECSSYNDCCIDAAHKGKEVSRVHKCQDLFPIGGIYVVNKCDTDWDGLQSIKEQCESTSLLSNSSFISLPVTNTKTGKVYHNYQCALCNFEKDHFITFWKTSMRCRHADMPNEEILDSSKEIYLKTHSDSVMLDDQRNPLLRCGIAYLPSIQPNLRYCLPYVVEDCSDDWKDSGIRTLCLDHAAFKISSSNTVYRNEYCALCNNVSESDLSCGVRMRHFHQIQNFKAFDFYFNGSHNLEEIDCPRGTSRNLYSPNHFQVQCKAKYFYTYSVNHKFLNYAYNRFVYFFYNHIKWYDIVLTVIRNDSFIFCGSLGNADDVFTFIYKKNDGIGGLVCKEIYLTEGDIIFIMDLGTVVPSKNITFYGTSFVLSHIQNDQFSLLSAVLPNSIRPVYIMIYICVMIFVTHIVTVFCLSLHVISFLCFSGAKTIFDYNVFTLVVNFLCAVILSLINDPHVLDKVPCYYAGLLIYFGCISYFLWISVIGFDVMRSIRASITKFQAPPDEMEWLRFFFYNVYAFGIPTILVGLVILMDHILPDGAKYKPMFGVNRCWFGNVKARLIYFMIPFALIVALVIIFFISIAKMILSNRSAATDNNSTKNSPLKKGNLRQRFLLFAKLACLVGVGKVLFIISDQFDETDNSMYFKILFKWTDILTGLFILHFTGKYRFYHIVMTFLRWNVNSTVRFKEFIVDLFKKSKR